LTANPLLQTTDLGLYCAEGDFFVDPWRPVDRAVITHAHSDHAVPGCGRYLAEATGVGVLRARLGPDALIDAVAYGEERTLNGVSLSLHPAGHILGSAQVRMERGGDVWVVTGDFKRDFDATCATFEPMRCRVLVSESTFGLPIYRWPSQAAVFGDIASWWRSNQSDGRASLLFAYSLGKAQRILAGIDSALGPIFTHGAVETMNRAYRASGVALPATVHAADAPAGTDWSRALILAPPSAAASPWVRRFGPLSAGFASGWMRIRGARRRRTVDRGFVLSDHADWPGLLDTVASSGAERVLLTHGYSAVLARRLREMGFDADPIATHYQGERDDSAEGEVAPSDDRSEPAASITPVEP
jgi:putative mRNA 3-end processing factor